MYIAVISYIVVIILHVCPTSEAGANLLRYANSIPGVFFLKPDIHTGHAAALNGMVIKNIF